MLSINSKQLSRRAEGVKERHVKRLNFGQPISRLSSGNELEPGNDQVARIASVHREDLVRKWLDFHTEDDIENVSVYPSSPACDTYVGHLLQSPVLRSRSRRRPKVLATVNSDDTHRSSNVDRIYVADVCGEGSKDTASSKVTVSPILGKLSSSISRKKRRNDETRPSFGRPSTPLERADITSSPVTDTSLVPRKKRHCIDTNMNSLGSSRTPDSRLCYESERVFRSTSTEPQGCKISQTSPIFASCKSGSPVNWEENHTDGKECLEIETSSSDEDLQKNLQNSLRSYSDSEKTISDLIEDDESQNCSTPQHTSSLPLAGICADRKPKTTCQQVMHSNASPKAVLSLIAYPDRQLSTGTSQIITLSSKEKCDVSNPVDLATTIASSPPRVPTSIAACTNLLDSGKKRRRPRKGSLLARLQLLINREKSFLRIWQHQMKSAESDKMNDPCIVFHVGKYLTHFDKYFLEGVVIEDTFKLLTNVSWITVIIISDIIDVLRIKCGNALKIYPPWDIINQTGTTMIARKFSVLSGSNNINTQCAIKNMATVQNIYEHACSCTAKGSVVPDCKLLHNHVKPDVLTYILGT